MIRRLVRPGGRTEVVRTMAKKKPEPKLFRTVWDLRAIPASKIDHFCEDLRLWLHLHKQAEQIQRELIGSGWNLKIKTPTEAFGWIDDGRHDANITLTVPDEVKAALDAQSPSVGEAPHGDAVPLSPERETE
jgi:hypothetical protein